MAKMIGDKIWHRECRNCCGEKTSKHAMKRQEQQEWLAETTEQIVHGTYCGDYFCPECGGDPDDFDANDNSDLDDIPGVWCDMDWRNT